MITMGTSGPDAPVLDSKLHNMVGEKEQIGHKTEVNGHDVDVAPKSDSKSESKSGHKVGSEIASDTPTDVVNEPTKADAEKSVLNASDSLEEQPSRNAVDTAVEDGRSISESQKDNTPTVNVSAKTTTENGEAAAAAAESKETGREAPCPDVKGSTRPSEDIATRNAPVTVNESGPETKSSEDKKAKETLGDPAKKATEDAEMIDCPSEKSELAVAATRTPLVTQETAITSQDNVALPTSEVGLGSASMTQLATETVEKPNAPAEATSDVSMADAPSSIKVARERDEDVADGEPAPKRARTEHKDVGPPAEALSEAQGEVTVSGTETPGLSSSTLTKLSNWSDEETNKRPISDFQRREMRKIIGRVKKTKAGGNFRDSVQKLWPGCWDSYVARVSRPMDLSRLDQGLKDPTGPYNTYGDFRKDLRLIFENALDFNGPTHGITGSAATAVKAVWEEVLPIPAEEPVKPKAAPKPKPVRESRAVVNADTARRQSSGPTVSPAADAAAGKAAVATQDQSAADRRSSTATEGDRPKRTVRAPKPKDIDYTTKPSRKKLKPELQFAEEVLTELMAGKHHYMNQWFMDPVDAEGLNIPTYYSVIKKPMDLNKVSRMLSGGEISNIKEFEKTVRLIFDNCFKFNGPVDQGNPVSVVAKQLEDLYVAQMKGKDAWLAKHAKLNAPVSGSNASDEEDEEEDGGDAAEVLSDGKEIEELQAKLDEETKKLNGMLVTSNQGMIDIQKNIVDMVQKTLISKAQEAQAARAKAKSDKPKKAGKSGKAKAGASGGRKSTGGQAKKAGSSKKAAPKKSLTAAQKDQIAIAINDLEYPHLERAIDIIKKDTGQNENNDGELELDVDQLSQDALSKLWDLCRKALPGFARDTEPMTAAPEASRPSAKQSSKASTAARPKKNKPMSALEQEQRIARLQALSQMYKNPHEAGDGAGVTQAPTPGAESSDDSDSEEE